MGWLQGWLALVTRIPVHENGGLKLGQDAMVMRRLKLR